MCHWGNKHTNVNAKSKVCLPSEKHWCLLVTLKNEVGEGNVCCSDSKALNERSYCTSLSSLSLKTEVETAPLPSSVCDVLVTHNCSCFCRPARHLCLKDSLSLSKISLFLESVWSHPCGAKGQKLAVQLRPVGMCGAARKRTVLGRSRVQTVWTSCTIYTTAS